MVIHVDYARRQRTVEGHALPTKVGGECVPSYPDFASLRRADEAKMNGERTRTSTEIYPGDVPPEATTIERRISHMVGLDPRNIIVYDSGMGAIQNLLELEGPTTGTVVLHGVDEYARTKKYIEKKLGRQRGVRTPFVYTASIEEIAEGIESHRPDIIFLETVGNGPNVPVIDLDGFFAIDALKEINPFIIFDNTLPTPTLIPPLELLREGFRVAVIESGIKAYSRNGEMIGVAFVEDEQMLAELIDDRITTRRSPFTSQGRRLSDYVRGRRDDFDEKNLRTMWNSLQLAQACYEAQGDGSAFTVSHPNVGDHPNREYADLHFPGGASPLFYIQVTGAKTRDEIAMTLQDDPNVNALIEKGHSFGTRYTRVFPDPIGNVIRVSAGLEEADRIEELGRNLRRTLSAIS